MVETEIATENVSPSEIRVITDEAVRPTPDTLLISSDVSVIMNEMITLVDANNATSENPLDHSVEPYVAEETNTEPILTEDLSNVESLSDCEKVESMSESEENHLRKEKKIYALTDDSYNLLESSNTSSRINIEDNHSPHEKEIIKLEDIITDSKSIESNLTSSSEVSPRSSEQVESSNSLLNDDSLLLQSQCDSSLNSTQTIGSTETAQITKTQIATEISTTR